MKNSLSPWNIKEEKFPTNGRLISKIKFLLNYAILAPSGHNTQPWIFEVSENCLIISPNLKRTRPKVDPENRELYISLGAAAKNIEVAADYFGMIYTFEVVKDKIVFKFKNGKTLAKSMKLFESIPKRGTYREEFLTKSIEREKIDKINEIEMDGAFIKIIEDKKNKKELANLISESDLIWFKSKGLVKELEGWLRDDVENTRDGLPTSVLNLYKVAVELKYLFSGDSEYATKRARRDYEQAINSPMLLLVATKQNSVRDWVEAGRLYEHLALTLTSMGLKSGFFNVVVQLKKPRILLSRLFKTKGEAQMLLRVGYGKDMLVKSSRRMVDEVLLKIG